MKKIYFTVGPSQIYPTVPEYIQEAIVSEIFSLSHRGKAFVEMYENIEDQLRKLLSIPETHAIFFVSSGTEAMERVIQNTVEEQSFHIVTGTFGDRFYKTAKELGKQPLEYVFDPVKGFTAQDIVLSDGVELIAFTHNDTSTGMQIQMEEIYTLSRKQPHALIAIDVVSSVPYVDIDYTKVDCAFFSVQKGFGLPAGLGVMILSPKALAKAEQLDQKGVSTGSYHSFTSLAKYAQKHQTPETPNVLALYLLNRVLGDFLEKGIQKIRKETEEKARMLYDYFASTTFFRPLVKDPAHLSQTTLVIEVKGGSKELLEKLRKEGFIVGSGYGERKFDQIRIANFPAHSKNDVARLLSALKKSYTR